MGPRSSSTLTTNIDHPSQPLPPPCRSIPWHCRNNKGCSPTNGISETIYGAGLQPSMIFVNLSLARCARLGWIGPAALWTQRQWQMLISNSQ